MTTTATRERPILFSAEMVRAILDGRKTQTRRVVKHPALAQPDAAIEWLSDRETVPHGHYSGWAVKCDAPLLLPVACPYGAPGDLLWVREAWRAPGDAIADALPPSDFVADAQANVAWYEADGEAPSTAGRLRPSIHMPRWASRLTLRVTEVRVQRAQDISEADAIAEGCAGEDWVESSPYIAGQHTDSGTLPSEEFKALWNSINAKRGFGWDANPWVWAITFEIAEARR
jgi:hypothetical protein